MYGGLMRSYGLKQIVPSDICLQCEGCCRFESDTTEWRPLVCQEERVRTMNEEATEVPFSIQTVDAFGYLHATRCGGECFPCQYFSMTDYSCAVYNRRPFECALYPFVFYRKGEERWLSVHLPCPYVRDQLHTEEFQGHIRFMKEWLVNPGIQQFLRRNPSVFHEYSGFEHELAHVCQVQWNTFQAGPFLMELKPVFEQAMKEKQPDISAQSFAGIAAWSDFFSFEQRTIDGALCVFASDQIGTFLYMPPIAETCSPTAVEACFDIMERVNSGSGISRIEHVAQNQLAFFPPEQYDVQFKTDEYCYQRQDILDLKGNAYKSQRSEYNRAKSCGSLEVRNYEKKDFEDCLSLYAHWAQAKGQVIQDEMARYMLEDNRWAHRTVLDNVEEFGVIGKVLLIDGKIRGYTFGYPLNQETFCVLFEVTDPDYKGISTFIFREFCSSVEAAPYRYVNVMDAMGLEGVRQAKESFHPFKKEAVFVVRRKG